MNLRNNKMKERKHSNSKLSSSMKLSSWTKLKTTSQTRKRQQCSWRIFASTRRQQKTSQSSAAAISTTSSPFSSTRMPSCAPKWLNNKLSRRRRSPTARWTLQSPTCGNSRGRTAQFSRLTSASSKRCPSAIDAAAAARWEPRSY